MSGGDWKEMFRGIQQNDFELVKYYLKIGIDPNYQHPEFMALPLAESIRYNRAEITKLLLEAGANPTIIEMETGVTVLELAKRKGDQVLINLLEAYSDREN